MTDIFDISVNVSQLKAVGVDFEASYEIEQFLGGSLGLRLFVNHTSEMSLSPFEGVKYEDAGVVSQSARGGAGTPKWRFNLTADYNIGNFGGMAQFRFIEGGHYRDDYTIEDINDNTIDSAYYLNVGAHYDFRAWNDNTIRAYVGVNNVLNRDPPVSPEDFLHNLQTNARLFDVIGRYWFAGLRMKF